MEPTITTRTLKYEFSNEELLEKARELSQLNKDYDELEGHAKAVSSEIRAKKDNLRRQITESSDHIADGHCFRDVECEVLFNFPDPSVKTVIRKDTGEQWQEPMNEADQNLFTQPGVEPDDLPM